VLIAASDLLPGLKERAGTINGEVLTFADADALSALETITKRRPGVVALERMFAVTPRGAALINRIKADPALRQSEIRVLSHDSDYQRIVPRTPPPTAPSLDQRGTRRAPRSKMAANVTAQVDGATATLIDLSTVGAQLVSPADPEDCRRATRQRGGHPVHGVRGVDVVRDPAQRRTSLPRRPRLRGRRCHCRRRVLRTA
jgi:hypothetical protein